MQDAPPPREALEGYDPVLLVRDKEIPGNDALTVVHAGFKYFFASKETKSAFENDPSKYAIQLGGICVRMGGRVRGNPNIYTVHDGRIFVFGTEDCKRRFEAAPSKFLEPPREPLRGSETAITAGRAMLERVAGAMGGAALDAATSYEERWTSPGPTPMSYVLRVVPPDRVRLDQTISGRGTFGTVLISGESFSLAQGTVRAIEPAAANALREELHQRHPVLLMRARTSPDFRTVAAGPNRTVVQVGDGPTMTLTVDAATHLLASVALRSRGPAGEVGELVYTYSDYRMENGVTLPFRVTVTFEGEPFPQRSAVIEAVRLNQSIDPGAFTRPVAAGKQ
jgi:YHS domain-containing protein